MKIHFWGVRGSIPSPGPDTVRYGGNTLCVSVSLADDCTLVLDAGTGLFHLGRQAEPGSHTYYFLLSHLHWDHIQGFPMFRQHMNPNVTIRVLCEMNPSWADLFLSQMDGIRFPITLDELTADVAGYSDDLNDLLSRFGVAVTWIRLNHRGECYGYKISSPSGTLMYITDHEMDATSHVYTSFDELATFCSDADILIHDGHFTEDQMSSKSGFGHTSVERACELAAKANAKQLVLFHHDPGRTDDMLDENLRLARAHLESLEANVHCITAFEGLHLEL